MKCINCKYIEIDEHGNGKCVASRPHGYVNLNSSCTDYEDKEEVKNDDD